MSEQTILAAIAALSTQIDSLRVDVMQRLDGHSNQLTAIRDDIGVNMAATDQAVRVNDNTRDEMRNLGDIVTAMRRQIRRLNAAVFDDKEG
jgi:hypothetical protein